MLLYECLFPSETAVKHNASLPHRTGRVEAAVPCVVWPCLTHVAKDCWKFLFCWNVTGVPILVVRTTLVPAVTCPANEPTMTLADVVPDGVETDAEPGF